MRLKSVGCDSSLFERYIQQKSLNEDDASVVTHPYLKGIYNSYS